MGGWAPVLEPAPSHSPVFTPNGARGPPRRLVRGTLIRLEVERLPNRPKRLGPLWLWWWGPEPPDQGSIWRVYVPRFSIGHTFRFVNRSSSGRPPRSARAADRWTWLVMLAYVQLRLARPLVVDHRLRGPAPLPTGDYASSGPTSLYAAAANAGPDGGRSEGLWALA